MKPQLKGAQSFESTCVATPRRRWWPVQDVGGCTPTTQSSLTTSFDRKTWMVKVASAVVAQSRHNFLLIFAFMCMCAAGQMFQCSHCSKRFATERLLRDHMRTHGQSCHCCSICVIYIYFFKVKVKFKKMPSTLIELCQFDFVFFLMAQ